MLAACSGGRTPGAPPPAVSVEAGASPVVEGTPLQFTLRVAPAPLVDLRVSINLEETGDVLAGPLSRTVTVRAGTGTAPLTVDTIDDRDDEPDSTVTATVAAGTGYALGADAAASVVVTDDDETEPPVITPPDQFPTLVTVTAVTATVAEGGAAEFAVHAAPPPPADLAVNIAVTVSGAMLAGSPPRTVTIVAGSDTATLTLLTVDDTDDEPAGTLTVAVTAGSGYTIGLESSASVTVEDNDEPPPVPEVTVAADASSVTEGTKVGFTLSAMPAPTVELAVGVTLAVTGSTPSPAAARAAQTVAVPPGDSMTTATVKIAAGAGAARLTVATADDEAYGPDRTLAVTLAPGNGYTLGPAASARVTIQDDDPVAQPPLPGPAPAFAYVAYDLTGLRGTELATVAAPELIPPGTLPIPFADSVVLGAEAANESRPAIPGTVTQGQCVSIESAAYPTRYAALGGGDNTYRIDLQGDHDTEGHLFTVDFSEKMAFAGMPNVPAGDYSYVLEATLGMQRERRAWKLAVTARELPVDSANDDREDDLHGDVVVDEEIEESVYAIAGDWANSVPEDFTTTDDTTATVLNVPRLALPGADTAPAGLSLDASINVAADVDVFWLGSLAPDWVLEVKVLGDSKQLDLYAIGISDPILSTVRSRSHQIGGIGGGLSCANHYLRVSGKPGQYRLGWRLTKP